MNTKVQKTYYILRIFARWGYLMSCPCITLECFKIDWLHVVDQGVAADFLGNLFKLLLPKMGGANGKERVDKLYLEIVEYYKDFEHVS